MQLSLRSDLEQYIHDQIRAGRYLSAEDRLTAAVERMKQDDRLDRFAPGEMDRLIAQGEADVCTGNTVSLAEARSHFQRRADSK